jgi:hypothetical protein
MHVLIATERETRLQVVRPATTGKGKGERIARAALKNDPGQGATAQWPFIDSGKMENYIRVKGF